MSSRIVQRVTLNLTGPAAVALEQLCARNGENQTDAVSRALLVRNAVEALTADGSQLIIRNPSTGEDMRVVLL